MNLEQLLSEDKDAAAYYATLPVLAQNKLRRCGGNISSLAALRDYSATLVSRSGPFYGKTQPQDGTQLDPELAAEWTREGEMYGDIYKFFISRFESVHHFP